MRESIQQRVVGIWAAAAGVHAVAAGALLGAWLVAILPVATVASHRQAGRPVGVVAASTVTALVAVLLVVRSHKTPWWAAAGLLAAAATAVLRTPHHSGILRLAAVAAAAGALLLARDPQSRTHGTLADDIVIAAVVAQGAGLMLGVAGRAGAIPLPLLVAGTMAAIAATQARRHDAVDDAGATVAEDARLRFGTSQISCLTGSDKRHVALPDGGVVAFRVALGVAVTAGDPLTEPALRPAAIGDFVAVCRGAGWLPCFFQTSPGLRDAYRSAGLRVIKLGEEAVVELPSFTLTGSRRANLRREVGRARRAGLTAAVLPSETGEALLRHGLARVSSAWLRTHARHELGFSLGRLGQQSGRDGWLTVVRDRDGVIQAFTSWLRWRSDGIAIDMVRRHPDAPGGAVDLCIATTLEVARDSGLRRASLGPVPMAGTGLTSGGGAGAWLLQRLVTSGGLGAYPSASLARFKRKFDPQWETRDIAYAGGLTTLRVAAALGAVHLLSPH